MSDIDKIKNNLALISEVRGDIANQENMMRTSKQLLAELRAETLQMLQDSDLKSMKSSTIAVSISHKKDVKIINPEGVKAWLRSTYKNEADRYLSIDARVTKPLLKTALWGDGEQIEGVERTETKVLTVTDIRQDD